MLIASHSSAFQFDVMDEDFYYIGDRNCGWDSCNLDLIQQNVRDRADPMPGEYLNCGIAVPMDLVQGDVITLCGMVFCGEALNGDKFTTSMQDFKCSSGIVGGYISLDDVGFLDETSFSNQHYACFSQTYIVSGQDDETNRFQSCNTFLVVGFRVDVANPSNPSTAKITWTLNVARSCAGISSTIVNLSKGEVNGCVNLGGPYGTTVYVNTGFSVVCPGYPAGTLFYNDAQLTSPFNGGNLQYAIQGWDGTGCVYTIGTTGQITSCGCC